MKNGLKIVKLGVNMSKEEFREALYGKVEHLPAEYAIKHIISDLIDEIYDLKHEQQRLKDLMIKCSQDFCKHGSNIAAEMAISRFHSYLKGN